MSESPIYRISPEVTGRRLDEVYVLLDLGARRFVELNDTAARVWELLGASSTLDRVVQVLGDEYEGQGDEIERDVREIVAQLLQAGLLVR